MNSSWLYVFALLFSALGGHVIVGLLVSLMRRTIMSNQIIPGGLAHRQQKFYYLWVGVTERLITTTLFIWAPTQLALFIGGWAALKLAAAWTRRAKDEDHTLGHVIALVGTAMSLSLAIAAGVLVRPESLNLINAAK